MHTVPLLCSSCILVVIADNDVRKVGSVAGSSFLCRYLEAPLMAMEGQWVCSPMSSSSTAPKLSGEMTC